MRRSIMVLALLLAVPQLHAESPLARLAGDLAEQIVKVAAKRPVELAVPEDRTRRGASLALDLRALVVARLDGRLPLVQDGPRLRIVSVLADAPRRLLISARVLEEPGEKLVDLLSASVEADDALLGLSTERLPTAGGGFEVTEVMRTPPLDERALALALVGEDRLALVGPEAVSLYRFDTVALERESRHVLAGTLATVRAPGALLLTSPDHAIWLLASRLPHALLLSLEGKRLVPRSEADALPWPGAASGLRYRPGTNLIEGELAGLGPGPFLAVATGAVVSAEGELRVASLPASSTPPPYPSPTSGGREAPVVPVGSSTPLRPPVIGPRVGPTLAALWPGVFAASSAEPPGGDDSVLLIARDADGVRVVARLRVDGAVRAIAGHGNGDGARLVAAVEEPSGPMHLVVMDVRRREP
jgi:hypothetical protein